MTEYNSLEEGLNNLIEQMQIDMPQFNQTVKDAFYTRCYAAERLMNAARDSCTDHAAWMNMVGNPFEALALAQSFDTFCWYASYEQLSKHFGVPLSWINALSLRAITDPMKMTWKVLGLEMMDSEGYLSESAYAAFLDGQEASLIPDTDDVGSLRNPDMQKVTEQNAKTFQEYLDTKSIVVDMGDALKGFDFTLA